MTPETRYALDKDKFLKKDELGYSTMDVEFGSNYNIYTLNFPEEITVKIWVPLDDRIDSEESIISSFEKSHTLIKIFPVKIEDLSNTLKDELKVHIPATSTPPPAPKEEEKPKEEVVRKNYKKPRIKVKQDKGIIGLLKNIWKEYW